MKHRDRQSSQGLLPRMEARPRKDGQVTYRYHPVGGKPMNLGTDKAEALRKVLDLSAKTPDWGTVDHLWREFKESRQWRDYADGTKVDYEQCSGPLLAVFGKTPAVAVRPADIGIYLDKRSAGVRANREISLMSNLMALAVRRGLITQNPCRDIKRNKERPRTRQVEPAELVAFLDWAQTQGRTGVVLSGLAEFCALAGSRRVEFLDMLWTQVSDSKVRLRRAKQHDGKVVWEHIETTPALDDLLGRLRAIAADDKIGHVFPNTKGNAYTASGFKTMWGRLMGKAKKAGVIEEHFVFHDLRAYHVTQYRKQTGALPNLHADPGTTARIYDRAKEVHRKGL